MEAASRGLAQQINDTKASLKPPAHTMEIYLARVPWWLAQMTRNVVFPIWNLILGLVFGSVTGLAGGALSGLESGFGSVKDAAQKGERAYDRISQVDNVGTDNLGDMQEFAKDPTGYLEDKLFGDEAGPAPPAKFPGGPRVPSGTGNQVPSGDGEVDTKWSKAKPAPVAA